MDTTKQAQNPDTGPRTRDLTLWLGAEGMQEAQGVAWVREPTAQEALEAASQRGDLEDFRALKMDKIGRPYWLVTVTRDAPVEVWLHISGYLRSVHLYH